VSLKNVLRLYGVYSKSYRLIAKGKFRNYRDSRWKNYAAYALLFLFGAGIGSLIALGINAIGGDLVQIRDGTAGIFVSLPVAVPVQPLLHPDEPDTADGANILVQPIYWFW
jgi:hypothetical protein